MSTMQELKSLATDAVVGIGAELEPDDDWLPTAFLKTPDGIEMASFAGFLDKQGDEGEANKDMMAMALNKILKERKATGACLVLTAWSLKADGMSSEEAQSWVGRVHEYPNKKEIVVLNLVTATEQLVMTADVTRGGPHPVLGPWESVPGATVQGRFINALRQALQ